MPREPGFQAIQLVRNHGEDAPEFVAGKQTFEASIEVSVPLAQATKAFADMGVSIYEMQRLSTPTMLRHLASLYEALNPEANTESGE